MPITLLIVNRLLMPIMQYSWYMYSGRFIQITQHSLCTYYSELMVGKTWEAHAYNQVLKVSVMCETLHSKPALILHVLDSFMPVIPHSLGLILWRQIPVIQHPPCMYH